MGNLGIPPAAPPVGGILVKGNTVLRKHAVEILTLIEIYFS